MFIKKFTTASAVLALMSAPAFANNLPTDFAALDADNSGTVTFEEYQVHSKAIGLSTTQAAQDFTRAAQGDALLTQDELSTALAFADQPYALQSFTDATNLPSEPMPLPTAETVEDAPVISYEPMITETPPIESEPEIIIEESEVLEPEILEPEILEPIQAEPDMPEQAVIETPLEDVAGQFETYESQTPIEEGLEDITEEFETDPLTTDDITLPESETETDPVKDPNG